MSKPSVQLVGEDGNIFVLLGLANKALKRAGQLREAAEMRDRVTKAGSYAEALGIIQEYVDAY